MLKNFVINITPDFQDITHEDGSKTYDTVYGMITIRKDLVIYVEGFLEGVYKKSVFSLILEQGDMSQNEYNKIIRIID